MLALEQESPLVLALEQGPPLELALEQGPPLELALEQGPLASKNGSQGLAVVQVAGAPLLVGTEHEHDVPELLRKALLEPRSARSDR